MRAKDYKIDVVSDGIQRGGREQQEIPEFYTPELDARVDVYKAITKLLMAVGGKEAKLFIDNTEYLKITDFEVLK